MVNNVNIFVLMQTITFAQLQIEKVGYVATTKLIALEMISVLSMLQTQLSNIGLAPLIQSIVVLSICLRLKKTSSIL